MIGRVMFDVVIVGGGACGLSTLVQLIEKSSTCMRVAIVDKSGLVGPGLAYSEACIGTRINTSPMYMGLSTARPHDFAEWLRENPSDTADGRELPFRTGYGLYLKSEMTRVVELAKRKGIDLHVYKTEVTDIEPSSNGWNIHIVDCEYIQARKTVLALGDYPCTLNRHLSGKPLYFDRAWPNSQLLHIPKTASVAILGSGLTAIDEALFLTRQGYTGQIYMLSRNGQLPHVQGARKRYERVYTLFNLARELEQSSDQAVFKTVRHFYDEINAETANNYNMTHQFAEPPPHAHDHEESLAVQFRQEVERAGRDENFTFRVLYEIRLVNDRYWNCLDDATKQVLQKDYNNAWARTRSPMPLLTGKALLKVLESGQVRVLRVDPSAPISYSDSTFHIPTKSSEGVLHVDSLIEATGLETNLTRIETPLMRNLLSRKLIRPHAVGGIDVDFRTMRAREDLYCIGTLTRGVHFLTATIDRNMLRAEWLVDDILGLPQREFMHVALFIGHDLFSQLIVSRLVPHLVSRGLMPYIYMPTSRGKSAACFEEKELDFYETSLLQDTVTPHVSSDVSDPGLYLTIRQLRQRYGVLVEEVADLNDPDFVRSLASNYIDVGYTIRCAQQFGSKIINSFTSRRGLFALHRELLPAESSPGYEYSLQEIRQPQQTPTPKSTNKIDYSQAMLHDMKILWQQPVCMMLEHSEQVTRGYKPASQSPEDIAGEGYTIHDDPTVTNTAMLRAADKRGIIKILLEAFAPAGRTAKLEQALEDACRIFYEQQGTSQSLHETLELKHDMAGKGIDVTIDEIVLTDDETCWDDSSAASSVHLERPAQCVSANV